MMTGLKSGAAALIVLALSLAAAACGGNPVGPTPPPTPGPGITTVSPATGYTSGGTAVTITGTNFQGGATLTFGGIAAVNTWVEPGGTTITATTPPHPAGAVDVVVTNPDGRTGMLSGGFTYTNLPQLSATSFLAFGDSITEGKVGGSAPGVSYLTPGYPGALQALLRDRFASQASSIAVNNAGLGGEPAEDGRDRLPGVLDRSPNTNVVILLEGANDLIAHVDVQYIVQALGDMIHIARSRNKEVLLTTLPPVVAPVWGGTKGVPPEALNDGIRKLAATEGVPLVDMYAAFGSTPGLLSPDGLHPSEAGYQKMAQVYFSEIIARYAK